MKTIDLEPIIMTADDYLPIAAVIARVFRQEIYEPLLRELKQPQTITNAEEKYGRVVKAILTGRISFYRGVFTGRFSSDVSRALREIGARWDRQQRTFKILASDLPKEVLSAVEVSESRFTRLIQNLDRKLSEFISDDIVGKIDFSQLIDKSLFKLEKKFKKTIQGITIAPDLPPERLKTLAREYGENMKLDIKNWTEEEILRLRRKVQKSTFQGVRYESLVKGIKKSYGVSESKAKFLARQETNLLTSKYKESRYTDAGIREYKWCCVAGSAGHEVRPMHKALEGKIFSFDNPPITSENGNRNNPGEDYGCRCYARPIVRFD